MYFFTYTEWGALLWLAPAWGIVLAYGMRYGFTNPMLVLLGSSWYFVWLIIERYVKNRKSEYINVNLVRKGSTSGRNMLAVVLIMLSLIGFGMYRTVVTIDAYETVNPYYVGAKGIYTIRVTSLPEMATVNGHTYWRIVGDIVEIVPDKEGLNSKHLSAEGEVVVYVIPSTVVAQRDILPGSYVAIKGTITKVNFAPEEGRIDLRARYLTNHRMGTLYEGQLQGLVAEPETEWYTHIVNQVMKLLGYWRYMSGDILKQQLPGELGDMSQSLLLGGGYNALDSSIMEVFAKTGLIHILSVSGSHIALLFGFIFVLASWLGMTKKRATYGAILFVIVYCLLVGCNPPVIRSALMGIIMGLGIIKGRLYQSRQALHLSAALLLWFEPLLLLDVSFQLSFGATYEILFFSRPIYQRLPKGWPYIMRPLSLCLSAQILIFPLQLYYFHLMGVGSLIAAILVGPILDFAILGTAILLLLHLIVDIPLLWYILASILKGALFLNFIIANIPGSVGYWGALSVGAGALYILGCRYLYHCMLKADVRQLWYENIIGLGLLCLLLIPVSSLLHTAVYIHIIPLSQGAAFLVLKEAPFAARTMWLHVATEGKPLSVISQSAIINAVHYYGVTKPQLITLESVTTENRRSLSDLVMSLHWTWQNLYKSNINEGAFIGNRTRDFEAIFEEQQNTFIARGPQGAFIFSNGQNSKNHLKLKEMTSYISGTTNGAVAATHSEYTVGAPKALVYWPNGNTRSQADVDPADENRYITGTKVIPDFLL